MPYLIGPNKAAMTPIRNKAANRSSGESYQKPAIAMPATAISTSLSLWATTDLSKRSATSPPIADRTKYGKMKIAVASAIRGSEFGPAHLNRIRKTSAFFRKLSLKALKNWHQNSGANRFVANRLDVIGGVRVLIRGLPWRYASLRIPQLCSQSPSPAVVFRLERLRSEK